MVDFLDVLAEYRELVFNKLIKEIPQKEPYGHYEILRDYPLRKGKYIRSFLLLVACEMFGGEKDKALNTAVAMQLSEEWLLIHDDIEDDSDMRRGKPVLHKLYTIPMAINAGDALYLIMTKVLQRNRNILGEDLTFEIMDIMNNTLEKTAEGQYLEIYLTQKVKDNFSDEDYYKIVEVKTCLYTIITPLVLGARIAGVPKENINFIYSAGDALGKAFQIQDDILNIVSEEKVYGKEIAGDIWEGKLTLMFAHLIRTCSAEEKAKVIEVFKKKRSYKTNEDVQFVLDLIKKYKSVDYARAKAIEFANKAREIFAKSTENISNIHKDMLLSAFEFMITRKS
ncbi:MAG: geranylgeranyl diphosphate synthase [Candidatus Huberarchaeum crystalense]|uniref:Geranylgeranyl diphosphate synthase n=1 Tax=Huberarchaeum crystalense TaxID=2014257 RepID=A0A2G9LJ33_HUBC1|nr:polyprenyl synthetase family protein [archaeon]PIN66556.1 MAG: geranylgeranyl diphosphate synthase [Candidatus Huberarchaeum crystalense]PIV13503.1 MAG: geranylgeranyl diphosphate synthase [Candidatus Huberarchaeum crystalense]PIV46608.1 MAG: geranylgeranyl diphosphate synthase [Candidatus Huberarchaeum crystalense]PIV89811.1 MAG: geranylgeranyl diphosphate synthase [Candidatus Huberarchaeum crystalense]